MLELIVFVLPIFIAVRVVLFIIRSINKFGVYMDDVHRNANKPDGGNVYNDNRQVHFHTSSGTKEFELKELY